MKKMSASTSRAKKSAQVRVAVRFMIMIHRANKAGGETSSPRRWRSRAWGIEPNRCRAHEVGERLEILRNFDQNTPITLCRQLRRLNEISGTLPQAQPRLRLGLSLSPPASQAG